MTTEKTLQHMGWTLTVHESEPMVSLEVLAARLEIDPRWLRQMVTRHEKAGHLQPVRIAPGEGVLSHGDTKSPDASPEDAAAPRNMLHGATNSPMRGRGRPTDRVLLNELDALFVISRSDAKRARELTRMVHAVFLAVLKGQIASAAPAFPEPNDVEIARAKRIFGDVVTDLRGPKHTDEMLVDLYRVLAFFTRKGQFGMGLGTQTAHALAEYMLIEVESFHTITRALDPKQRFSLHEAVRSALEMFAEELVPDHEEVLLRAKCAELELQLEEVRAITTNAANG